MIFLLLKLLHMIVIVSPMGLDCQSLTYCLGLTFESVFPQLVTVFQLPYDNAHVNVDTSGYQY